ncbi:uncharacterized membrane protein YhaH (DUF805 family) [Maritimibacter alkaliphilus HTCC2654]|uniref:DUF805 domain-containing protein n=1 Tax=Maritimibacter alkaliphilus HTCC2654 TaxID=314271 RepID=A3VC07_9RHOB|nr:DUF805 domain-containing protein [Maritimibacter alkaliphilus]EAQ14490.1 hypothetical protein RB2654_17511 [Rhodobacterales bacterium HTCC2654] [Maritimibacter alkaliphilus HTCC2654]TYP82419.1 uncharacterized membrane protein YhaH (DUF805 family) [Maritimibacter alkaliphilus HTCC2654]
MIRAVAQALRNYATFRGRTGRRAAWWFLAFFIVGNFLLVNLTKFALLGEVYGLAKWASLVSWFFFWSMILPMAALTARRLQDIGKPGALTILPTAAVMLVSVNERRLITQGYEALIPVFIVATPIFVWFFYWLARPGDPGDNAYGPPPGA